MFLLGSILLIRKGQQKDREGQNIIKLRLTKNNSMSLYSPLSHKKWSISILCRLCRSFGGF